MTTCSNQIDGVLERLHDEFYELLERYAKLEKYLNEHENESNLQISLMKSQYKVMGEYLQILNRRMMNLNRIKERSNNADKTTTPDA